MTPRPTLLLVTDTLAGGLGDAVVAEHAWFTSNGWDVVLAAGRSADPPLEVAGSIELRLPRSARDVGGMMRAAAQIRALRRTSNADVVHCNGIRSFVAARLSTPAFGKHAPWVTLHGKGTNPKDPRGYNAVREFGIAMTPLVAGRALSDGPNIPRGWTFLPHASRWMSQMDELGPPTAPTPTFLWLGRLNEPKLPDVFVRAIAELARARPDVRGVMTGDGAEQDEMKALAASLNAPVDFVGHIADPRPYLKEAWAVVLISTIEGLPRALEEAAWAGRAIVSSPLPGAEWLVDKYPPAFADGVDGVRAALDRLCDRDTAIADGARHAARAREIMSPDMPWPQLNELFRSAIA